MKKEYLFFGGLIFLIVLGIGYLTWQSNQPSKYDDFAKCIKDKGAIFYGAFWCPHCQNQKAVFGSAKRYLPYVECSTADGKSQLPVCNEQNISGYPTWVFADSSRESGELSFEKLAEKTSCPLPEN